MRDIRAARRFFAKPGDLEVGEHELLHSEHS
jgi:hypothetical protein